MRLSTSPQILRNKITQNSNDYHDFNENNRSNSLSHLSLHSSKFQNRIDNSNYSPYYNQNSQVRIISQQQLNFEPKTVSKLYGSVQTSPSLEISIKNLCEKVQTIQKRLKKQETQMNTLRKTNDQRYIVQSLQEKINQEIYKKSLSNYEQLFKEMKRIESQISQKIQLSAKKDIDTLNHMFQKETHNSKVIQTDNSNILKKNAKIIEDKVKQEIFKLQIHLQNEITKQFNLKKIQGSNDGAQYMSIVSKSKLKYKFRPLQINVKNQVSLKEPQPQKRKKQALSTAHSSGSSQQSQTQNNKTIELQEHIYYIDKEGYLLDENGFYLLNQKQKMIKIDKKLIKKLQDLKMID